MAWFGVAVAVVLIATMLLDAFEVMILPRRVRHSSDGSVGPGVKCIGVGHRFWVFGGGYRLFAGVVSSFLSARDNHLVTRCTCRFTPQRRRTLATHGGRQGLGQYRSVSDRMGT